MNDKAQLAEFANEFWNNYIKQKVHQDKSDAVSFYRATVVTNNNNGTVTIKRPFGDSYIVNCADNMTTVSADTQVLVLRFGNGNNNANHLVVAKGDGGFGVLPAANGGTGLTSITRFLKGEVPTTALNGDADNAPYMSVIYVSNATVAATIAHLPRSAAGHLVTIGGTSGRAYQFYLIALQELPEIWVRRGHTTYSNWYKMFDVTPSFTSPTMTSGRATLQKGGYYLIGNRAYVEMTIRLDAARAVNTQWTYGNGFPAPNNGYAPLSAYILNKQTYTAAISTSGILSIANGATATAVNDVIYISGSYLIAT